MRRLSAGARTTALLFLLALGARLGADDHFRTGGIVESEPFPGSPTKVDQRFHIQDDNTNGVRIHYNCHGGDTVLNGNLDFVIPPGVAMTWDISKGAGAVNLNWLNQGNAVGAKLSFSGYTPDAKTLRFNVTANWTAITDFVWITGHGFSFPDPDLPAPGQFPKFADPFNMHADTVSGAIQHADNATVRIARPPSGFGLSGPVTLDAGPGPTAMTPLTLTESNTIGNGGIWSTTGIKINIPASLDMKWHHPGGTVQATCSGTAVTAGRIAANPVVTFPPSDSDKTVLIPVIQDFQPGESVTISGLSYATMVTDSTGSLRVNLGNSSALTVAHAVDTNTITIAGQPKISSATPNVFSVGDPTSTLANITVTESLGTPRISSTNGVTIVLPTALANVASFASSTITCTGTAVTPGGHVSGAPFVVNPNAVDSNKTITIPVTGTFSAGDTLIISGLKLTGFTGPLATARLRLDVNGNVSSFEATDDKTTGIGQPSISSGIDQVFINPPQIEPMQQITITDDPVNPRIFPGTQIRIAIPSSPTFFMTWQGGLTATTSSNLNSAVTYAGGNKILIVTAAPSWTPGGSGTVSGLNFSTTATSLPDNLELFMSATGTVTNIDNKLIAIGGIPTMSSGIDTTFNQEYTVNDPSTPVNLITLTDAASPSFQAGNSIEIVIPSGLHCEWKNSTPTFGGSGASHITSPSAIFSYPDPQTLRIFVNSDFGASETLTIDNLFFTQFSAASAPTGLQLRVNIGGPISATDNRTKAIGAPTISSATNQVFGKNDLTMDAAQITITDDGTTPRIKPGTDIRVRIPSGFNMVWAGTAPALSGTGAGNVSAPSMVGGIMTITVNTPFAPGQTLIITGAQFTGFNGLTSGVSNLELEVNNKGLLTPNAFDNRSIKIGTRPAMTGVTTVDTNGNGSIDRIDVKFSEAVSGATTSVTTGKGFTLAGYSISSGAVDGGDPTIVHFSLIQSGLPDTGATPALTYNPVLPAGGNLTDVDDGLTMTATAVPGSTVDRAAPVIINFAAFDTDGNGFLDQVVATFSENLAPGQADINDWVLIDANGTTNLLAGLTNANVIINNNTVTIVLLDSTGTTGTPRFEYLDDGLNGALQDLASTPNFVGKLTNNTAPVAIAGQDISAVPSLVTLNGSRSIDPDGQALTFSWTQIPTSTVTLLNPGTATPSFQTAVPGTYNFRLDVSDGLAISSDFVTVNILNVPPTATPILNQVVQTFTGVTLRGVQSTDINGDALTYTWSQSAGPAVILSSNFVEAPTFTPTLPGAYQFGLVVKDIAGNDSPKGIVRVTVHSGGNHVPVANAGPDQTVARNTLVTLDARQSVTPSTSAPPPVNQEPLYTWSSPFLATPVSTINPILTFTPPAVGTYTFTLVVRDRVANLDSFPDSVTVIAFDPSNRPPAASASKLSPIGTPLAGEIVTLDGTASVDPEGALLSYGWSQTAGPRVFFDDPGGALPRFTPILPGTYEFQLVVSDGAVLSPPATVRVSVKPNAPYVVPSAVPSFNTAASIDGTTGHVVGTGTAINLVSVRTPVTTTWWWEQTSGPAVVLTPFPFNADPSFTPTRPGLYRFRVTATDHTAGLVNRGFNEIASIDIVVDDVANAAPVANAGLDQPAILTGEQVTLNGSGSTDDNTAFGSGLIAYWKQLVGPPVQLSDPYASQPTFVATAPGVYVFELVVNDGTSSTKASVTQVVVSQAPGGGGGGSSGGGGSCGLSGLEALVMLLIAARMRRR
jgi:hypothetical protein